MESSLSRNVSSITSCSGLNDPYLPDLARIIKRRSENVTSNSVVAMHHDISKNPLNGHIDGDKQYSLVDVASNIRPAVLKIVVGHHLVCVPCQVDVQSWNKEPIRIRRHDIEETRVEYEKIRLFFCNRNG